MFWFIIGITAFSTTLIGFMTCLALWTYENAKVKSRHPPILWVLIVLLVPMAHGK